ncbi:putative ddenn domain-containing protein [Golovinomyces cichoracearum]|uniref:Putative ddenn domain-containing protein n=1 Tax=Golovinomyces cichoracearum TaxID=62708 RepID=A0A420IET9_9PEZI|nr:putative ddenn domain-containing protein [Golovinomyces cichoracearum]
MDKTSAPLADYFWIAGIDSNSYRDFSISDAPHVSRKIPPVGAIDEDGKPELPLSPLTQSHRFAQSRKNSKIKLSKRSSTNQEPEEETDLLGSKRSSAKIKGSPNLFGNSTDNNVIKNAGLGDIEFDRALLAFTSERELFLDEISFSAGAQVQKPLPMTQLPSKGTDRLQIRDAENLGSPTSTFRKSPLRVVGGSIRRRMSFRDMNSMKKQPNIQRNVSVRTCKRLSDYNSVIPPPEPINADPEMHPLRRRFEPVLLDRYPPKTATDETHRRGAFPDYLPMFAFPNDIQIVSADERPRSTWHGFAMTTEDAVKIYGIAIIVWTPLNPEASENLERRCEEWRQSHMSNEERELAASLAERLALERAHLSQLLAQLPTVILGSSARDILEEQISVVEEKISLMTDLLRPVRHGAAAKIDGLTDGETGLWIPRAFGIIGRDGSLTSFWKEWLRAVIVPMSDGGVLRVPASSPKIGTWQPLERYVVNLCTEAFSPISSKTQVELAVRELKLFARKEAVNELPGSRNTDLYALFRSLSIPNIVSLFEFVLSESRIILLSSHTAMLHLASSAIVSLLYPLKWASIFIPVLPARLLSALEAPCPYIVGIERRYENIELPEDDYVLVDLDQDVIEAPKLTMALPRQQRRKLISLIQLAAPHHNRCGVPIGPPPYAIESFPYNAFSSENDGIFTQNPPQSSFAKYVSQNSTSFGEPEVKPNRHALVFNAFLQSKNDHSRVGRPSTSKSTNRSTQTSPPTSISPVSAHFSLLPSTPVSRNDSGFALTATLREKRSGHFDGYSRRSSSFGIERQPTLRRPSVPFTNGHHSTHSNSALSIDARSIYGCPPSTYAASTLAASTIMPNLLVQPVLNTNTTTWVEGHCFELGNNNNSSVCSLCDEKADGDGIYNCRMCGTRSHGRCLDTVSLVCPSAFHTDRIRAAFVRCFASLFFTYRKFLMKPGKVCENDRKLLYKFDMEGFSRSLPSDQQSYVDMLRQTQGKFLILLKDEVLANFTFCKAFNEFIHERETIPSTDPSIQLFDNLILAKKSRGRTPRAFLSRSKPSLFLESRSEHLWRSAAVPISTAKFPGDYHSVVSRIPAQLDVTLMREPRVIQGVPRIEVCKGKKVGRKAVPSIIGGPDKDIFAVKKEVS